MQKPLDEILLYPPAVVPLMFKMIYPLIEEINVYTKISFTFIAHQRIYAY